MLTEVFYPTPDLACVRQLGFLVTDGAGFASDESRDAVHAVTPTSGVAPVATLVNTCLHGRYRIEKTVLADPRADVVLQRVRFTAAKGDPGAYRLFAVLEPHLGERGDATTAALGDYKGHPVLLATASGGPAVALACSSAWAVASAAFAGGPGSPRDVQAQGRLTRCYRRAGPGSVVLTAGWDRAAETGELVFALAFAASAEGAAQLAVGSLFRGFEAARTELVAGWERWASPLDDCRLEGARPRAWDRSVVTLKTLESNAANGGRVAALSTPWGESRGPGIDGTYHLVWTRDLVESASALLAAGTHDEAKRTLFYLRCTQEADGHWPQNMLVDGKPVWNRTELDEVALPVLLLHLVAREGWITEDDQRDLWPMVRKAARFLARRGPSTQRDRWEDTEGITPFTLAASIAALVVAADLAELAGDRETAADFRGLADDWSAHVETWLYRRGGKLAEAVGVPGYYVRARRLDRPFEPDLDLARLPRTEVGPDVLALVRFGIRAPDDPRIADTVRVVDAVLRSEFAAGPAWRRYPGDAYGEHDDGAPFDGSGTGRPWPLFTGERAHYELARGRRDRALALLRAMESFAGEGGYMPEQIWDGPDVAGRGLVHGAPTGSATPLGWTHAEYVKLCRSLADGKVFDRIEPAQRRYLTRGAIES